MTDKDTTLHALDKFIANAGKRLVEAINSEDYGDAANISGFESGLILARLIVAGMEKDREER